jgi:deferrochelatase/peroxidase EfeB
MMRLAPRNLAATEAILFSGTSHSTWAASGRSSTNPRAANGDPYPEAAELLAGKIVGRWPSGGPLVLVDFDHRQRESSTNAFLYSGDEEGVKCPLGAHIRRANPRDSLDPADQASAFAHVRRRRILRRGRSFGKRLPEGIFEDDNKERGLHFICLCADIERQFEFIQQSWLNNPDFANLCNEVEPLTGSFSGRRDFNIPGETTPRRFSNLPDFVTVKGGGYFFLPSLHALRSHLATA